MPFEQLGTVSEKLSGKELAQFVFQSNRPIITKFILTCFPMRRKKKQCSSRDSVIINRNTTNICCQTQRFCNFSYVYVQNPPSCKMLRLYGFRSIVVRGHW